MDRELVVQARRGPAQGTQLGPVLPRCLWVDRTKSVCATPKQLETAERRASTKRGRLSPPPHDGPAQMGPPPVVPCPGRDEPTDVHRMPAATKLVGRHAPSRRVRRQRRHEVHDPTPDRRQAGSASPAEAALSPEDAPGAWRPGPVNHDGSLRASLVRHGSHHDARRHARRPRGGRGGSRLRAHRRGAPPRPEPGLLPHHRRPRPHR